MFHTRPGKSYRALSADCPVHSKGTKHKSTLSSEAGSHSIEGKGGTDTDIESDEADSIVVLPFPFQVQGGIPYYEETDSRFTHRPFLNGSDREVFTINLFPAY